MNFSCKCKFLISFVHCDVTTTRYAACSHSTSNYGCVRCHTTHELSGYFLSRLHTCISSGDVSRRNKDNFSPLAAHFYSVISCEYNLLPQAALRCSKCFSHWCSSLCCSVELWVKAEYRGYEGRLSLQQPLSSVLILHLQEITSDLKEQQPELFSYHYVSEAYTVYHALQ